MSTIVFEETIRLGNYSAWKGIPHDFTCCYMAGPGH